MNISPHFTLAELTVTSRRDVLDLDHDGDTTEPLPNVPDDTQRRALASLCAGALEPIRELLGVPLRVSSGFRSEAVNRAIGGARGSQHMRGEAADVVPVGYAGGAEAAMGVLLDAVCRGALVVDQLILYPVARTPFIHVSYTTAKVNRNQVLVSAAPGGSGGPYSAWTP